MARLIWSGRLHLERLLKSTYATLERRQVISRSCHVPISIHNVDFVQKQTDIQTQQSFICFKRI